jgi:hypothetical protein
VEPRRDAGTGQVFVEARHRQPMTKTGATRVLALPSAAVEMLHRRRAAMSPPAESSPVFAHAGGGWLWPNNHRTKLRAVVRDTSLAGATPHTLRTVGTVVAHHAGLMRRVTCSVTGTRRSPHGTTSPRPTSRSTYATS